LQYSYRTTELSLFVSSVNIDILFQKLNHF